MIKEFLTCPICKKVLPADRVSVQATVDGDQTLICQDCNRNSESPELLLDIPDNWRVAPTLTEGAT